MQNLQKEGLDFSVVNARFVKPLDEDLLNELKNEHIVTIEDNVLLGGFGAMVCAHRKGEKIKNFAYRDEFIPQGSIASLQADYGVNCKEIEEYIKGVLA